MKKRRIFFTAVFSVILIYFVSNNFSLIKPFKDLKSENIKEISLNKMDSFDIYNYSDEKIIKKLMNTLKKIKIYKKVSDPILSETNVPVIININSTEKEIYIIESSPYISIDNSWYKAENRSFNRLKSFYEDYLYSY